MGTLSLSLLRGLFLSLSAIEIASFLVSSLGTLYKELQKQRWSRLWTFETLVFRFWEHEVWH